MKWSDIQSLIQTGDLGACSGTGFVSDGIKLFTGRDDPNCFTHIFVFFREDGVLKIAEEWAGANYQEFPAAVRLPQYGEKLFWLVSPSAVRANPDDVMAVINRFRTDKKLDRYGIETYPLILAAEMGAQIPPDKAQPVCVTVAQDVYKACGVPELTVVAPEAMELQSAGYVSIEL